MATTILRSKTHSTIAHVEIDTRGVHTIRDASHRTLGYYDPRTNRTQTHDHRTVGYGYQLPRLLSGSLVEEESPAPEQRDAKRRAEVQRQMRAERTRSTLKLQDLQARLAPR